MKILIMAVLLLASLCQQALALQKVSDQMIGAAQEYGRTRAELAAGELQKPWTVPEQLNENVYADAERIIVFTPYLIVAMDAQNKTRAYEEIKLKESSDLASAYEQVFIVGAIIDAPEKLAPDKLMTKILQDGKSLLPYHAELVAAAMTEKVIEKPVNTKDAADSKLLKPVTPKQKQPSEEEPPLPDTIKIKLPVWNLQYYFYFEPAKLNPLLPLILKIDDRLAGEREFRFHLANMN